MFSFSGVVPFSKIKMFSFSGLGPFSPPSLKRWKAPRPCWKYFYRLSSIFLLIHLFISDLLAVRITFAVLVFPGNPVILSAFFSFFFVFLVTLFAFRQIQNPFLLVILSCLIIPLVTFFHGSLVICVYFFSIAPIVSVFPFYPAMIVRSLLSLLFDAFNLKLPHAGSKNFK